MPFLSKLKETVEQTVNAHVNYRDTYAHHAAETFENRLEIVAAERGHGVGFFPEDCDNAITLKHAELFALKIAAVINHEQARYATSVQQATLRQAETGKSNFFKKGSKDRPVFNFHILESSGKSLAEEVCYLCEKEVDQQLEIIAISNSTPTP